MRKRACGAGAGYNQLQPCSKIRAFMNQFPTLLIALALLLALPARAEKADRDKPMNAEADALR